MTSSNMHKFVAILGAILCIIALIPVDVLSWWKVDFTQVVTSTHLSNYISAFGYFTFTTLPFITQAQTIILSSSFQFVGIIVLIGAIIMFAGGLKGSKGIAVIGAIVALLGPILFLVALNGLDSANDLFLSSGAQKFFGSGDLFNVVKYGAGSWYLNIGFFLPIIGAVLGFLSAKSSSK